MNYMKKLYIHRDIVEISIAYGRICEIYALLSCVDNNHIREGREHYSGDFLDNKKKIPEKFHSKLPVIRRLESRLQE